VQIINTLFVELKSYLGIVGRRQQQVIATELSLSIQPAEGHAILYATPVKHRIIEF
jgi:hypothetical protein